MNLLSIDFGTSFCAAAYMDEAAQPVPVCFGVNPYNAKCYKFPTVIQYAYDQDGVEKKIIGEIALANLVQSNKQDSSIISKIKTELRERTGYIVNGQKKPSTIIVADIFQKIKEFAENQAGVEFDSAIITHPAQYESVKQDILREAALKCGFSSVFLLDEPIAASYSFIAKHQIGANKGAVVFDYGGGTIDIAYLWYDGNNIKFKFPPISKINCGGEYIDLLLHNYIHNKVGDPENKSIVPILLEHCSKMKVNFSTAKHEEIVFNNQAVSLDVNRFEKIISQKVKIALDALKEVANICKTNDFPVDYVFMNGGSSRLNIVRREIAQEIPDAEQLEYGGDDLAVAIGAIIYYQATNGITPTPPNSVPQKVTYHGNRRLDEIRKQYKLTQQ